MNWKSFIVSMAGPAQAVIRYGLTALGGWLATKGWVDDTTWQTIAGALLTLVSAGIGVATSTSAAVQQKAASLPSTAILQKTDGTVVK